MDTNVSSKFVFYQTVLFLVFHWTQNFDCIVNTLKMQQLQFQKTRFL